MSASQLLVGYASATLTVPDPVHLLGQFHMRLNTGVQDDVAAQVMFLGNDADSVIFVSIDTEEIQPYLVTEVQDIVKNDLDMLILEACAAGHMPEVLELPYRPPLRGGFPAKEKPYTYRLSSMTCLAGDVIGDYSFTQEIHVGDRLVFEDMAIYSMVKNNTFNGMPLPAIAVQKEDGTVQIVKEFGYEDFKMRLS